MKNFWDYFVNVVLKTDKGKWDKPVIVGCAVVVIMILFVFVRMGVGIATEPERKAKQERRESEFRDCFLKCDTVFCADKCKFQYDDYDRVHKDD